MITLLGIPFDFQGLSYYRTDKNIEIGEQVIVKTDHGTYLGTVKKMRVATEEELNSPDFDTTFPAIERIATYSDKALDRVAKQRAIALTKDTQKQANSLNLGMKVLSSYFDCEDNKALITFTSETRVDFRELVKILTGMYRIKIELRQIGPRDQARLVGGIGPCGLPLCCTTFLTSFDGISIAMAKNQLLAINIPKLSGQCGKLMCCLKYEDDAYQKIRPLYPKIGEKFTYNKSQYEVTGLNLLTDTITTYNGENYESFTKEEFERVKKGLTKTDEKPVMYKDINSGVDLSGHGINDTNNRIAQIKRNEERRKEEKERNNQQNQKGSGKQNNSQNNNTFQKNKDRNNRPNNQNNRNNNSPRNNQQRKNTFRNNPHKSSSSSSGFIPVSQIQDKSVLDVKPIKNDDKK